MTKTYEEAVYNGFCEITSYFKNSVEVQVEDGEDEYGSFVRVRYENLKSSKYYYDK